MDFAWSAEDLAFKDLRGLASYVHQRMLQEVQELEDKRLGLHADIKSREMTGTYQGGDDKFKLVETSVAQRELAKTERLLLLAQHLPPQISGEVGARAELGRRLGRSHSQ